MPKAQNKQTKTSGHMPDSPYQTSKTQDVPMFGISIVSLYISKCPMSRDEALKSSHLYPAPP